MEETFDLEGVEAGSLGQAGGLGDRITVNPDPVGSDFIGASGF